MPASLQLSGAHVVPAEAIHHPTIADRLAVNIGHPGVDGATPPAAVLPAGLTVEVVLVGKAPGHVRCQVVNIGRPALAVDPVVGDPLVLQGRYAPNPLVHCLRGGNLVAIVRKGVQRAICRLRVLVTKQDAPDHRIQPRPKDLPRLCQKAGVAAKEGLRKGA